MGGSSGNVQNDRTYELTCTAIANDLSSFDTDTVSITVRGAGGGSCTGHSVDVGGITVEAGSSASVYAGAIGFADPTYSVSGLSWVSVDPDDGFVTASPSSSVNAGIYTYTLTASGGGCSGVDTVGTVTVTDGTEPDPCVNAAVTAPDLSAPLGGSDSGAATQSGFPSGSGVWTVTEQPDVGVVSVSSNGTVSWDAPDSQPSPGDSTDYAVPV